MKKNTILLFLLINSTLILAQRVKLKNTINYNAFGMQALPYEQLMVGGNHIFHKNLGFALSYRFGIKDFLSPKEDGTPGKQEDFQTVVDKNLFTEKYSKTYSFFIVPSLAVAIRPKWPIYGGIGITRKRIYREYLEMGTGEKFWIEDKREDEILPTFTVGTFIPITGRLMLNVAYDHLPQSVFIGFAIRSWDSWNEFN